MRDINTPRFGTIDAACKMVGGDRPIDPSTYYRGAAKGIYPAPVRVGPNISRVDLDQLAAALRARATTAEITTA